MSGCVGAWGWVPDSSLLYLLIPSSEAGWEQTAFFNPGLAVQRRGRPILPRRPSAFMQCSDLHRITPQICSFLFFSLLSVTRSKLILIPPSNSLHVDFPKLPFSPPKYPQLVFFFILLLTQEKARSTKSPKPPKYPVSFRLRNNPIPYLT